MRKKSLIIAILAAVLLTACGNSSSVTEPASDSSTGDISESIYFYGEYVIDGDIPDTDFVYDRIVFFPDGRCYAHYSPQSEGRNSYVAYNYSYCSTSNYVGFDAENASFEGLPSMSENRTLLKFDNYVLKRVDDN